MANLPAVDVQAVQNPPGLTEFNRVLKLALSLLHLKCPDAKADAAISPHGGDMPEALRERDPVARFDPRQPEKMATLLGPNIGPQEVRFARNVRTDQDAVDNYSPHGVARLTAPADPSADQLGVFVQLRISGAANAQIAKQCERNNGGAPIDLAAAVADGEKEEKRLGDALRTVREAAHGKIRDEIARIETKVSGLEANGVPMPQVYADRDYRRLYDLRYEFARLDALLSAPAETAPAAALPPIQTSEDAR